MKTVKIGNSNVGKNQPIFISFEPGATYSSFEEAKNMLLSVVNSGGDAVKFQTFLPGDAERMMGKKDITVKFSDSSGQKEELVLDALKRRELSKEEWQKLIQFTKSKGLNFITAPYFPETINFLEKNNVDALKISKGDVNNSILIDAMAKTKLPIIIDAREKLEDIDNAIEICLENHNEQIIIMHCPSGYPSEDAGVHLNAIPFLQQRYDFPIAFADHSPGDVMNFGAIAMGATMLEKTITVDKMIPHVEHFMSLELSQLNEFVKNVRKLSNAMGNDKILYASRVEENARRSLVAKRQIIKDTKISLEDLDFTRPGDQGISCSEGFKILGKMSIQDISEGEPLQWDQFE